ncbi:hypothetical protein U1Q18_034201 [Sarracenia purpurea var. burkii]
MNSLALMDSNGVWGIVDGSGSTGGRCAAVAIDRISAPTPPPPLSLSQRWGGRHRVMTFVDIWFLIPLPQTDLGVFIFHPTFFFDSEGVCLH